MRSWFGRVLARPIGEGERHRAFLVAALVLVAAAAGLTLVGRPHEAARNAKPPVHSALLHAPQALPIAPITGAIPAVSGGQVSGTGPAGAMAAGRAFLTAYLRFAYGQAPPRFPDATPDLRARLAGFHVAVSEAQRARHLALLALRARPRGTVWEVTALASDGTASFPIAVIVARQRGRWLATHLVTVAGG